MTRRAPASLLLLVAGCVPALTLEGAACPCAPGYTCDARTQTCLRAGASAPDAGLSTCPATAPERLEDPCLELDPRAGVPGATGFWAGDPAEAVREAAGATPAEGERMVALRAAGPAGGSATARQIYQLVAVTEAEAARAARIVTCVSFDRVGSHEDAGDYFSVFLRAYPGDPATFESRLAVDPTDFGLARADLTSIDETPGTWQRVCASADLPSEAEFIALEVRVNAVPEAEEALPGEAYLVDDACLTVDP